MCLCDIQESLPLFYPPSASKTMTSLLLGNKRDVALLSRPDVIVTMDYIIAVSSGVRSPSAAVTY